MKKIGRFDYLLWLIIALVGAALVLLYLFYPKEKAGRVTITVNQKTYGTYDLHHDQEIPVVIGDKPTNIVVISQGVAYMKEASCPDHLCKKQGEISYDGQTIVCLPNQVVVQVDALEEAEFDSVAK